MSGEGNTRIQANWCLLEVNLSEHVYRRIAVRTKPAGIDGWQIAHWTIPLAETGWRTHYSAELGEQNYGVYSVLESTRIDKYGW